MRVLLGKLSLARRLDRGLAQVAIAQALAEEGLVPVTSGAAEVACVLDPAAAPVRGAIARVAIVDELAPRAPWREAGDRFAVVDEQAAAALAELGVVRDHVSVTGWPLASSWATAGVADRDELRRRYHLDGPALGLSRGPIVLVDTRELGDDLPGVILQLSLASAVDTLFDAPDEATAAVLRARCPAAGIRARRFGETTDSPSLWRAADLVVGRPRPQLIAQARAVGLAIIAVADPRSAEPVRDAREAEAVAARGAGRASSVAGLAAALDLLDGEALAASRRVASASARPDAARALARLLADVAQRRAAILAEPAPHFPAVVPPSAPGGPLEEVGVSVDEMEALARERTRARAEREAHERELDDRLAALKARLGKTD